MRRLIHWRGARAAGLGVLVAMLLACAPATRVQVLSFFFDGVPGAPRSGAPGQAGDRNSSPFHPARPQATPRPTPLPIISTHRPVAEKRCKECHESGGRFAPIEMSEKFCDKCHREQRVNGRWDHGPINMGTCVPCHRAHESPYPHLLDQPELDVCLRCHIDDLQRPIKGHQGQTGMTHCTVCHDPHRKDRIKPVTAASLEVAARDGQSTPSQAVALNASRITTMTSARLNHGQDARATTRTSNQ